MKNSDKQILTKLLREVNDITDFIGVLNFEQFMTNKLIRKAVAMSLINIGELARHFSSEFVNAVSLPIQKMVSMRNAVAHGYNNNLDFEVVWDTANASIPKLKSQIEQLLK